MVSHSTESREIQYILKTVGSEFILGIKYAKWDNLCGPKVIKLWGFRQSEGSDSDSDSLVYVSNHILNGEVWRLTQEDCIEIKLYLFPKIELITLSAIFIMGGDMYSLSFLFPISHLHYYIPLNATFCQIIRDRFSSTCSDNKIYEIEKILLGIIPEFINIRYNSLFLLINETLLINNRISLDRFLQTCCSSHLQTGSRSVVCGRNIKHIHSMLHTLAYFMLDEDRPLTQTYSGEDVDYRSYLFLQAYSNIETARDQLLRFGCQCVTIIDLENYSVQVFQANHIRKMKIAEAFLKVRGRAKLIKDLCNDMDFLPNIANVKDLYIRDFLRLLMKKAFALLSLESILKEFESRNDYDPGLLFSQIKQDLLLERDEDLGIILSMAHRICPTKTEKMLIDFAMISASQVEIKSIL